MFDIKKWFMDLIEGPKTTSLENHYKQQAYLKERINSAEKKGKEEAKAEAKQEKAQAKAGKGQGGFSKFQDYCDNFANQQSVIGEMNPVQPATINKKKRKKMKKKHKKQQPIMFKIDGGNIKW